MILIVDSGHNEETLGKRSPDGRVVEYEYTRRIALEIMERFKKHPVVFPIYLDDDPARNGKSDEAELKMRIDKANTISKDAYKNLNQVLLLSIHLDASPNKNACGASVFISPNASSKSDFFARILRNKIVERNLAGNRVSLVKVAKFGIIHKTMCPAVLVECAFMTNKKDVDMLLTDAGFNNIVNMLCDSVSHYYSSLHYT